MLCLLYRRRWLCVHVHVQVLRGPYLAGIPHSPPQEPLNPNFLHLIFTQLRFQAQMTVVDGVREVQLLCPYLIVNRTHCTVALRDDALGLKVLNALDPSQKYAAY